MKSFEELGLMPEIVEAVVDCGFKNPLPVQEEVIPLLLSKSTDILALAQTGTGKTAAFGLPIIQQTKPEIKAPQTIILSPTRELCLQIADDLKDYSKYVEYLKILAVYGGSSIETQIKALRKGVHIIVATPGRLIDLINRKEVKTANVERIILDEADEMLNMGFSESIDEILKHINKDVQTLLFSATMPQGIGQIADKYMNNPVKITIGNKNTGVENIRHFNYTVQAKDKYLALKRIADFYPNIYGIVFCRTRKETQEIADKLMADGYNAESLHGDLSQAQRDMVMNKFRIKNVKILVATDVAARGLDVDDLSHVINYSLPDETEGYTHRSGRTGRVGKAGISIVITNLREKSYVRNIEKSTGIEFINSKLPSGKEICEKQLYNLIDKIEKVEVNHIEVEEYLKPVYRKLEWLDKEELIRRLVSVEFNRFLQYYQNAVNIDVEEIREPRREKGKKGKGDKKSVNQATKNGYTRIYINIGKIDKLYPNILIDVLKKETGIKLNIGKIDIYKNFSLFEIDNKQVNPLISSLKDLYLGKRKLIVKVDEENSKK